MVEVEVRAQVDEQIKEKTRGLQCPLLAELHEEDSYFKFQGDTQRKLVIRTRVN